MPSLGVKFLEANSRTVERTIAVLADELVMLGAADVARW